MASKFEYRVVEDTRDFRHRYSLHKYYYQDNVIGALASIQAGTLEDMKLVLDAMATAFDKPIIQRGC